MTIHLIAAGELENPNKWSDLWHHCYNIWKKSPYKIKLWNSKDLDNLLKEDDEEFFNIINKLPSIYKFDYVRYLILEKFGGAYFDMDVEILVDFIPLLNPNLQYFMGGSGGTIIENSIMIANQTTPNPNFWNRFRMNTKYKILKNLDKCSNPYNVLQYAGAWLMTEILITSFKNNKDKTYGILGYEQFSNPNSSISFSKHHYLSEWNILPSELVL